MSLLVPPPNRFQGVITNCFGTRPSTSYGTTVTPGNNTYPAFTDLLGGTTSHDAFWMDVLVHGIGVSAAAKDAILKLGFDHSGGTSYTSMVISDLLVSMAGQVGTGGMNGIRYSFPIYVPSGTRIGGSVSVNNATVGTSLVAIRLHGKPSRPGLLRAARYVDTFGSTPSTSSGTTITSGTTSDGSWTLVKSGLSRSYWWWQVGMGMNDSSATSGGTYAIDVAVGPSTSSLDVIFQDMLSVTVNSSEMRCNSQLASHEYVNEVPADGSLNVYVRMQCSVTPDSSLSVAVYAAGG